MIAQIFNPTAELVIPIGIPTNETNTYMERNPVTAEMKKKMLKVIQIPTCF